MNRKIRFAGAFAFGLFACVSSALATDPRACLFREKESPSTGLPAQDPPVIVRERYFSFQNEKYPIMTFSDTAKSGKSRSEQCLRYEVENIGKKDIHAFRWRLPSITVDPLEPGNFHRRSEVQFKDLLFDPQVIPSVVRAFNIENLTTNVWGERPGQAAAPSGETRYATTYLLPLGEVDAGLPQFAQMVGWGSQVVAAARLTDPGMRTHPARKIYSGPGFLFETISEAVREGPVIQFKTTVTVGGPATSEAVFGLPGLSALGRLREVSGTVQDYEKFFGTFKEFAIQGEKFRGEWVFSTRIEAASLKNIVFRVGQPIVIKRGAKRDCFLAFAFSPLATNFNIEQCDQISP